MHPDAVIRHCSESIERDFDERDLSGRDRLATVATGPVSAWVSSLRLWRRAPAAPEGHCVWKPMVLFSPGGESARECYETTLRIIQQAQRLARRAQHGAGNLAGAGMQTFGRS